MKDIILPPLKKSVSVQVIPRDRHISIVGGGSSGKSRFMEEMINMAGSQAWPVGSVDDSFPATPRALQNEFAEFLKDQALRDTPLFKRLRKEWEELFKPLSIVVTETDEVLFSTSSGSDLIDLGRLSRSERAGLYYSARILQAPRRSVIFVDSPTLFLHPTAAVPLWNRLEHLRPDCRFVYDTTDPTFVGSRLRNVVIWVKAYDAEDASWDYEILPADNAAPAFVDLIGSRRPILFIEGDADHSIDARLYSLVFPEYTVRPLGSCDKVIETTRTFRYLKQYHPLKTIGIVDRDRRSDLEVRYLRQRSVMVAEVAEVENIFLSEPVVRIMARSRGLDEERTLNRVREIVFGLFTRMADEQALQHTRHRMKRDVERKIDARFTCITALELHIKGLINTLHPREIYQELTHRFHSLLKSQDYAGILKVFNYKPMLTGTGIPNLLSYGTANEYIEDTLRTLRSDPVNGPLLREAILSLFTPPDEEVRSDAETKSFSQNRTKKSRKKRKNRKPTDLKEPAPTEIRYKSKTLSHGKKK